MINEFKGEYRWLSNFYPCAIRFQGKRYPSVEHAYQSAKSDDRAWKRLCASDREKARVIKKKSRDLTLPPDWDAIKLGVMRECLQSKFSQEPFRTWLLETGTQEIREGNTWGDTFWGVDLASGRGHNHLGQLLMEIRASLRHRAG